MKFKDRMTDDEVMQALRADTPINRARAIFSSAAAGIEQENLQRRPGGPIEGRRMEFEAIIKIAAALGVKFEGPYPGCHHPERCNATGRCPRDPVCFN